MSRVVLSYQRQQRTPSTRCTGSRWIWPLSISSILLLALLATLLRTNRTPASNCPPLVFPFSPVVRAKHWRRPSFDNEAALYISETSHYEILPDSPSSESLAEREWEHLFPLRGLNITIQGSKGTFALTMSHQLYCLNIIWRAFFFWTKST